MYLSLLKLRFGKMQPRPVTRFFVLVCQLLQYVFLIELWMWEKHLLHVSWEYSQQVPYCFINAGSVRRLFNKNRT